MSGLVRLFFSFYVAVVRWWYSFCTCPFRIKVAIQASHAAEAGSRVLIGARASSLTVLRACIRQVSLCSNGRGQLATGQSRQFVTKRYNLERVYARRIRSCICLVQRQPCPWLNGRHPGYGLRQDRSVQIDLTCTDRSTDAAGLMALQKGRSRGERPHMPGLLPDTSWTPWRG